MHPSTKTIEELMIAKFRCQNSTLDFTRFFFRELYGRKFIVSKHHRIICEHLDKVISGEITKLIINIAPRYGKTELAVKNFIAHGLCVNPAARFIHLSYSNDLALDNSEGVKNIVTCPSYQAMFPARIKQASDSKKKWYTTSEGGVYATSAKGQVTGFGAGVVEEEREEIEEEDFEFIHNEPNKFGGALIIDDPIKPEEADSDVIRTRINERWDSTIKNRVNSRNTPIIIIMQRLHEEDLAGYVMKQAPEDWTVLSLPAIQEDGTALWEHKHTVEELNKMKKENEVVFDRQYMQTPKPLKGLLFPAKSLEYFSMKEIEGKEVEATFGYIDVADKGIDFLSFPTGKKFKDSDLIYITDIIFDDDGIDITEPLCAGKINELNHDYVRIETNNQGGAFKSTLSQHVPDAPSRILGVWSSSNKHTRIMMESGFIKKTFRFRNDYVPGSDYDKFMKKFTAYKKNGTSTEDDAPDSGAGLAKMFKSFLSHIYKSSYEDQQKKEKDEE